MGTGGFITLHRVARDSWLWSIPSGHFKVALTILMGANWKHGRTYSGGAMVTIRRGQLMTSIHALSRDSGQSHKVVKAALLTLRVEKFITEKTTNRHRIITVCNYSKYQDQGDPTGTSQGTPQGTSQGTPQGTPIEQGNKGTKKQPIEGGPKNSDSRDNPKAKKDPKPPSEVAAKAALYLQKRVLEKYPNCQAKNLTEKQLATWARTLAQIESKSGGDRSWKQIRRTIDWLWENEHNFIVMCPSKIKNKWDSMQAHQGRSSVTGKPKPESPYTT